MSKEDIAYLRQWYRTNTGQITEAKKKINKGDYKRYTGPAGPEADQTEKNTEALLNALQKLGVNCKLDNGEYAQELWGGDEKMIVVTRKDGQILHASYDRYGFVVDELDVDQMKFKPTLAAIVSWYKSK